MIQVQDLFYRYVESTEPVLKNISMVIHEGEYMAIIGPNGCGKTTLVRHLNGLLRPTEGDVRIDEMNTRDPLALKLIRRKVGMVFQNPDNQLVGMTVEEDVSFGPGNLNLPPPEIRTRVEESLEVVGMKKYAKSPPFALSAGEKQLVAIAGVLAMNPQYIVFDEPTAYLDPSARGKILQVMRELNGRGITIVHVTHNMDDIAQADRVFVMNEGTMTINDEPARVFSRVEWLKSMGLGVPKITELMWKLSEMGAEVNPHIFTVDDACNEICALLKRQEGHRTQSEVQ